MKELRTNIKIVFLSSFLIIVTSFLFLNTSSAQTGNNECPQSSQVPDCMGSDIQTCSGCSPNQFCCPLTTPGACADTVTVACTSTTCNTDTSRICKVTKNCDEPSQVLFCTGSNATSCAGCSPDQYCCPSTGECSDSFNTACQSSSCTAQEICEVAPAVRSTRNLTFVNNCSETIWVAASASGGLSGEQSGFELDMNAQKTVSYPGNLQSANFWPRTSCTFPCTTTPCCQTGDCGGTSIECNGGTKSAPANSFEPTFNESPDNDFYDITNVDGYTVGIAVKQINGVNIRPNPTINGADAPQLNCGSPVCTNFDMSTCPPELSEKTASGRQICWSLGGGANNADQRMNNPTGILSGIAASCDQLALVGAACSAKSTGGTTCGSTSPQGCADPDSLYCCSPYNDQLPPNPGGIGCADANDPNYVNPCSGVWPLPDSAWCSKVKEKVPSSFCTYNGIYENQCPHAYSWQFNDSTSTYQCINPDYKITFCPDSSNTDHDSQLDSEDTDSDNDGIPDSSESAGGSLNKNPSTIAANGINDPDSDGIPNELDLDSDGDGIPDHVEAGGENDSDSDGYADNFVDSDSDGHNDEHDPDQTANVLPIPDTDGDGMPDFLDTDSDGDGVSDTNETTGMDVDGDGMHDDSEDMNKDGLADSVHPSTGMPLDFIDTDEDGIFDHLDASDDINFSDCINCVEGCSLAVRESRNFFSLLILIPAIVLIRRLRRK